VITVTCSDGSWAEAPCPASAIVAAKALCDDAYNARAVQGHRPTVTFHSPNGEHVATVRERDLWRYAA
jgi:hypothetical protein